MSKAHVRDTSRWKRFAAGVVLTVLFAAAYVLFLQDDAFLERRFEDVLLWKARAPQPVAPEVTVIQIDDGALDRIQKWPWDWDIMAGIIDSLSDLGARVIALDIIYSERPQEELRPEALAMFPQGTPVHIGERPDDVVVNPLPILVDAIRRSGRTVLTYSVSTGSRVDDPLYQMVEDALVDAPSASAADVGGRLGVAEADVQRFFVTARQRALEILVARDEPVEPKTEAAARRFGQIFPTLDYAQASAERQAFNEALLYSRRAAALFERAPVDCPEGRCLEGLSQVSRLTTPLPELIEAAASLGFATVFPDRDGVIRRVPLLAECNGRPFPQLGLRVAMLARGCPRFSVRRADAETLEIVGDDGRAIRIPVGPKGEMIINWSRGRGEQQDGFRRLPISRIYQHSVLSNIRRTYLEALAFAGELLLEGDDLEQLQREIDDVRRTGQVSVTALQGGLAFQLRKFSASKPPEGLSPDRFQRASAYASFLAGMLKEQDGTLEIERAGRRLAEVSVEIRDAVADRVCLIGMTATSAAMDLKPTPIHDAYPGVFAHASIADNVLREAFVRDAPLAVRLGMVVLVGLAVTLCAGWLPTLSAALASLAVTGLYYLLSLAVFTSAGVLMPLAWPSFAGLASLLVVMVYRELTEGRNRRWITGVFKQYTSDKMVDELVQNPDFLVLGGQRREMTVYFSDIAGFTSLSERLDPPQLVAFLQTYLEEMTDRLLEQGATLDKYEGDAVLAFYGAPLVQQDHAARCLGAALAHLRALPVLNERLKRDGLLPADCTLRIRIGISSGSMVVGNFGSARRFDYTVIGDSVNVGARLEGANKAFGTTVLVSGPTREQAGDGFLLRRIGPVRFVGKDEAIETYELLDPEAPPGRQGLEDYDAALADFEGGWYHEARQKFQKALLARPGDGPTLAYLTRIDALLRDDVQAKPGPWDLTSK